MKTRKLARKLHLWLGMASGLVVFVLCVSGCLLAFELELRDRLEPHRHVPARHAAILPPSVLRSVAERQLEGETASRVVYEGPTRAAYVQFGDRKSEYYKLVFLDPYDATVLKTMDMNGDFLHIVFSLHYRLWLPSRIGTTIVDYATLVFVAVLVTGLVNWWPRHRRALVKRLVVKWHAPWRRRNYDWHRVLGGYSFPILLIIALTGMVWGFEWFNDAVYWVASGGESRPPVVLPSSADRGPSRRALSRRVDEAWQRLMKRHSDAEMIIVFLPSTPGAAMRFVVNPHRQTYYKTDHYYVDPRSLSEYPVAHAWGRYHDANTAAMVRRLNYDIHIGAVAGLPGKLLVFTASLFAASLPATGLLIWWGKGGRNREVV
jgi:uncharacterized iron-regulated membrane protein